MSSRRLIYALYDANWVREKESIANLSQVAVTPLEYENRMEQHLYCPQCYENIVRVPNDEVKTKLRNGTEAYFRHVSNENHPYCSLRSSQITGRVYTSEEDAKKAIENEEFIVLTGFMQERPNNNPRDTSEREDSPTETYFEDKNGRLVNLPIARHRGREFKVPSKISSVQALVVNFLKNYYREIVMVNDDNTVKTILLCDTLKNVNHITKENPEHSFYYGIVRNLEKHKNHSTIWITINDKANFPDFRVKVKNEVLTQRGWTKNKIIGKVIVFYSSIIHVGTGYWTPENLCWGEVAMLPDKYKDFLLKQDKQD